MIYTSFGGSLQCIAGDLRKGLENAPRTDLKSCLTQPGVTTIAKAVNLKDYLQMKCSVFPHQVSHHKYHLQNW